MSEERKTPKEFIIKIITMIVCRSRKEVLRKVHNLRKQECLLA